jgi:glutaredoxin
MKMERLLAVCVFALVSVTAAAADTYRWEDKAGNVHYGDEAPPAEARNIQRPRLYGTSSEQVLPYRLQLAVSRFPVTLYVTDCGQHCDSARELLLERGVPHTLLDANRAEVQEELMALTSGAREVPVVKIGKTVIRGFEAERWHGALDFAGYPSYPVVDVTPTVPPVPEQMVSRNGDTEEGDDDPGEFDYDKVEYIE